MSVSIPSDLFLTILNGYLEDNSFIVGTDFSQADTTVFAAISSAPNASSHPHLSRWFNHVKSQSGSAAPAAAAAEEDDDMDLFGSDDEEEDAEAEKLKQQRLAEYAAKKAAKGPGPAAKSMVTLDVKPWDDETDLKELEANVRSIEMEGLKWGVSQLVAIGYGIKKLRISAVIVDELVSTDLIEEKITEFEDFVQSVDVEAFQKL
ncbi:Elongation factor 1-beta [Smittium culicis]|uniref:Elongation factor 1-beta n=1 Tax=Smittium culicis TaxID=133412 RepID=A0A1R1YHA8_9FUNG|nr:Elongation factor 1-beta [Smittium culicis]OMJ26301.1 Elongation factor 1-beta [Smittium culicis]